jgi:hypothetical protein
MRHWTVNGCTEQCRNQRWMHHAGDMTNMSLSVANMLRNIVEALEETKAPLQHVYTTLGGEDGRHWHAHWGLPVMTGSAHRASTAIGSSANTCAGRMNDILHGPAGKYYGMHFGAAKSPFDERDPVSSMIPRRHAVALLST